MEENKKPVLVSGLKPTGRIHLGNFFGAMKQVIDLSNKYDTLFFVADFHALTAVKEAKVFSRDTYDLILDSLGAGIDPDSMYFYKQSDIPEVTELCWFFDCIINVSYLTRAHAYKDAKAKGLEVNAGTFNYPVLMAADILIHKAEVVPVGEDQRQHIEYARDIAEKFNSTYKDIFPVPKEVTLESVGTLPGTDGRKMSKSYNNTISLFADRNEIEKIVKKIPTDSKGVDDPKDPDECFIFKLFSLVAKEGEVLNMRERYKKGGIGYKEAKDILIEALDSYIKPLRERRKYYENDPDKVKSILKKGAEEASFKARRTLEEARRAVGILSD
ncbi:MAG: tryptophan--tRNA ligase [Patescibacteria group bacterium]